MKSWLFMHVSGQMINIAGSTFSGPSSPHKNPDKSRGALRFFRGFLCQPKRYGTLATMSLIVISQMRHAVSYSAVVR